MYVDHKRHNLYFLGLPEAEASINRIYGFYDECKRRYSIRRDGYGWSLPEVWASVGVAAELE